MPAAMHGTISQDLCEILPKRLSPAAHQTAQPASIPSSTLAASDMTTTIKKKFALSSEEVEHRTAFHGSQHPRQVAR